MWKPIIAVLLAVFTIALLTKTYFLYKESSGLEKELLESQSKIESLNKENNDLKSQVDYFSKQENVEKELKAKFNYKNPDEKMMIIVP
ncbi:MAG: septum formation initiator family protein [Patescibacteria group bacterium]|nr:septum formation initiator family protein [Patescibacteria group bacterium]